MVEEEVKGLQKDIVRLQVKVENLEKADAKLEEKVDSRFEKMEEEFKKRFDATEQTLNEIKEIVLMSKGSYKTLAIMGSIALALVVAIMKFFQ